ncbi:hypothetical protein AOLI_G00298500 [Acnodon oligacanthus]
MIEEEAPGQEPKRCPAILDLVFYLSDGPWRMLTDVSSEVSKLQLPSRCTNAVVSVAKSAVETCVPALTRALGMQTDLLEDESEPISLSGESSPTNYTAPSSGSSAERSSVDPVDRICDTAENAVSEVNEEMEKSICNFASSEPSPKASSSKSEENLSAGFKWREDSSHPSEPLVAQLVHIAKSRETTANRVSRRFRSFYINYANDVSGGMKRIYHPTTARAVCSTPALQAGSAVLMRSPRRTVTPRFQFSLDSCTDVFTFKVVELNKRELVLSSSSKTSLHVSTLPRLPAVKLRALKPKGFLTEAVQAVSGDTVHEDGSVFEEGDSASPVGAVSQTRVTVSMDQFTKMMLQHVLSLKPGSSGRALPSASLTVLDQDVQETSTMLDAQESSSNECLSLPVRTCGEPADPLALLENSEQAESDSTDDISAHDVESTGASPTPSIKAGSQTVKDTLENCGISSQETCSSTSSIQSDREAVAVKKSHRFNFFKGKKAPVIRLGQKKSTKACPAGVESKNHQSASEREALRTELTVTPFKKTRKRLSRMFSAVRKALPNPFSCMTRPS